MPEDKIDVRTFAGADAQLQAEVEGLLAAQPELADKTYVAATWQSKVDENRAAIAAAAAAQVEASEKMPISAEQFIGDDRARAVPVAGLLADKPELADAEIPVAEWQSALAEYVQSPRP